MIEMILVEGIPHAFEVWGSVAAGEDGCYDLEYEPLWSPLYPPLNLDDLTDDLF